MPIEREQAADLLGALVSLLRAGRTVANRDSEHSVSATPIQLLRLVRDSEPRMGDLADQLRVKPSVVSRVVAALEADGHLIRVADPEDARACRVQITDAGREHLADREDYVLRELARTFDDWSPADAAQAARLLSRIEAGVMDWVASVDSHARAAGDHPVGDRPGPVSDDSANAAAGAERPDTTQSSREMTAA